MNLYRQGKVVGGLYRSLGQEATAVGAAFALEDGDLLVPLIRDIGATLVRGATPLQLFAQYLARDSAPSRGKDGHIHFSLPEKGIYSSVAMLGTVIPVLTGMLLAERYRGRKTVGLTYIGDGGTSVGAFHEGLNFAAVQRLPLVLIVEFNGWAYSTPYEKQCAARTLADKAIGYGIPGEVVDGNDVMAVYEVTKAAVEKAREGHGPTLIECKTYRMKGHAEHDAQAYVNAAELDEWRRRDPIARFEQLLLAEGILALGDRAALDEAMRNELDEALTEAEAAPSPAPSFAFEGVYADDAILRRASQGVYAGAQIP